MNKAEDVNRMLKGLIGKTLMDLDYEFYKEFPNSATCGATVLIVIIIQSRVFVYNLGACKGLLLRNGTMFQINTEHKPTLGDERIRLEKAGAFVKNDRLLGKCPISRCIGQFEFKVGFGRFRTSRTTREKSTQSSSLTCHVYPIPLCLTSTARLMSS